MSLEKLKKERDILHKQLEEVEKEIEKEKERLKNKVPEDVHVYYVNKNGNVFYSVGTVSELTWREAAEKIKGMNEQVVKHDTVYFLAKEGIVDAS